jgi:hypothetical protein
MEPLSNDALRQSLETALAMNNEQTNALAQDDFSAHYGGRPGWEIGPFAKDDSLTFTPTGQWTDPTGIGWTSESAFNPSIIEQDGRLVMFYRASPRKETTSSRIGIARHTDGGWQDDTANPVLYPTLDNELLGCEDPKIYRAEGRYYLFYNGIFPATAEDKSSFPSPDYPVETVGCDINLAVSDDLVSWEKLGPIIDHEVSRLWAKGAVIPRDANGDAVKIGGAYLMYLSEGCNGVAHVGRSSDMVTWAFSPEPYLDLAELKGSLHEVACAITGHDGDTLVLDFFYGDENGDFAAAQALYSTDAPFVQRALNTGGSLAWGGLIQQQGTWLFAQGWDAPRNTREIYFYRGAV